jgi:hypothetical protein
MDAELTDRQAELSSLQSDYEDFAFDFARAPANEPPRFEAIRTRGDMTLSVLITSDAGEMRAILDAALTA